MPSYRLYKISADGHVAQPPDIVECQDDISAIKAAEKVLDGEDIEIWRGENVVSYLVSQAGLKK